MMDFITIPITFGIGVYGFYKLTELFVRKRERIMIIEKLSQLEKADIGNLDLSGVMGDNRRTGNKYLSLRLGSLLMGVGAGLLIGMFIVNSSYGITTSLTYEMRQIMSVVYGASTLCFGGLGLIAGFVVERWLEKNQQ
jgi:hypothetical protein